MKNYTEIEGLTDQRRLPRLGRIRLGLKIKNNKGIEHPKETDYFVIPDELKMIYDNTPKEIDVMIVNNDKKMTCPAAYTWYGSSIGVKCKGNGKTASRKQEDGTWEEISCPCEKAQLKKGGCCPIGYFSFMIPQISMGGVYQISTKSINSIIDVRSGMDYAESFLGCSCAMLPLCPDMSAPLRLKRVKTETHHDGKRQIHYTLQLLFEPRSKDGKKMGIDELVQFVSMIQKNRKSLALNYFLLPPPEEKNPEYDPVDLIEKKGITDMEDMKDVTPVPGENKTKNTPELASDKTTKEEKADTLPPKEKASESEKSANPDMSTLEQQQSIHILATKAKIDVYKKYEVKSAKDFSFDRAEEIKKELSELLNKQIKDKGKPGKEKEFLPKTIKDCRLAIISIAEQLGVDEAQAEKEINERCGPKPTLPQLQAVYKQYAKQLSGE